MYNDLLNSGKLYLATFDKAFTKLNGTLRWHKNSGNKVSQLLNSSTLKIMKKFKNMFNEHS